MTLLEMIVEYDRIKRNLDNARYLDGYERENLEREINLAREALRRELKIILK